MSGIRLFLRGLFGGVQRRETSRIEWREKQEGPSERAGPHEILGIRQGATRQEIRTAYRRLVRRFHPDLRPEAEREWAEERLRIVNGSYQTLMGGQGSGSLDWREAS
jgi:DnaJ-class molecular chaperone